ncbi:hypothetical protein GF352_00700 [archaeon]|nr:hypothetical protein [archaeon]
MEQQQPSHRSFKTLEQLPEERAQSQAREFQQPAQAQQKPPAKKSVLENKKLAVIIGVIGFIIIGIVFFFLFRSVGVI